MQGEFQCSYSLQLLLGNQQQILTAHFHVSPFAFHLGRVLVLLQLATTMDSNLVYVTGSPRSKKRKEEGKRARARKLRTRKNIETASVPSNRAEH